MPSSDPDFTDPTETVTPQQEEGNIPPPAQTGVEPSGTNYVFVRTPRQPNQTFTPQGILQLPMQNNYDWANTPTQLVERFMAMFNVSGDLKDLIDGTRVYRVRQVDVVRFPKDGIGYYVGVLPAPPGVIYRFVSTDPSLGVAIQRDWMPVGLGDKTATPP